MGGPPLAVIRNRPPVLAATRIVPFSPRFLPDGKLFVFYLPGKEPGIYLGTLGKGGDTVAEPRFLTSADSAGEYIAISGGVTGTVSGWLVFLKQNTLVARRFDAARGQLSGDPVTLAQPVGTDGRGYGAFSVSRSGLVAWRTGTGSTRQLVWLNRAGERTGTMGAPDDAGLFYPELSPDGRRVAVTRGLLGARDIWLTDATRSTRSTRFTFDLADDTTAVWSPDGSRVVFSSDRTGTYDLYLKLADGSRPEKVLLASADVKFPSSWSPDGRFLLYQSSLNTGDLMVLPLDSTAEGGRKPYPFLSTPFNERSGAFSPDGKWVAYQSNESGRFEVYVRPFPSPGGVWQISTGGGIFPRWRGDGKELYYVAPGNKLMAAAIAARADSLSPGQPVALFSANFARSNNRAQYDVARDGRFLVNVELTDATPPITLLQNWKPPR